MQTRKQMAAAVRLLQTLVAINLAATVVLMLAVARLHPEMAAGLTMAVALLTLAILAMAHRIGGRE